MEFLKHGLFLSLALTLSMFRIDAQVDGPRVRVEGEVVSVSKKSLSLRLKIINETGDNIFVATEPVQLFGKKGFYVNQDGKSKDTLAIASKVFPDPPFLPYTDRTSVILVVVGPKSDHTVSINLPVPLRETLPSYETGLGVSRKFRLEDVKQLSISFGYFDDPRVKYLVNRPIKGSRPIDLDNPVSRRLVDIQKTVSTTISLTAEHQRLKNAYD